METKERLLEKKELYTKIFGPPILLLFLLIISFAILFIWIESNTFIKMGLTALLLYAILRFIVRALLKPIEEKLKIIEELELTTEEQIIQPSQVRSRFRDKLDQKLNNNGKPETKP